MGLTNWQLFFLDLQNRTQQSTSELNSETLGFLKQVTDTYDYVEVTDSLYVSSVLGFGSDGYWRLAADSRDSYLAAPHNGTNFGASLSFGHQLSAFVDGSKSAFFGFVGSSTTVHGDAYITTTKNNATHFTLTAWVYPITYDFFDLCIVGTSNLRPVELALDPSGNLEFYLTFTASSPGWTSTGTKLPLNTWSFISITWDGSVLVVYVNAVNVFQTGIYNGLTIKQDAIVMGRSLPSTTSYFHGYLAHVAHFPSALTSGNLTTLYSLRNTVLSQYSITSPPFVVGSALVGFSEVS